jgi:hypothetical protein
LTDQGYLDPKPSGIDARYAWGFPGGRGAGIGFVDLEQGWNLEHEDLAAADVTKISGINDKDFQWHGTAVLGVVLMADNNVGGVGIAPAAKGRVVSQLRTQNSSSPNNPDAILSAISSMAFGDVLLLEVQEHDPAKRNEYSGYWPAEIADATYDAITLATALGIVVVEAAGDGERNLDDYENLAGEKIFDQAVRDSGAIIVGAGSKEATTRTPVSTNTGERIDCYAWGENIGTAIDEGTPPYTRGFGATSGASAIVAGAALVVQGMAKASLGRRFSPRDLREILKKNGTPLPGDIRNLIGVMPDLKAIIDNNQLNLAPDLYLRDYVGDTGSPTTGTVARSPDIIVRQAPVADPQGAYGAGSGTEDNPGLSQDVAAGQINFVYVRVLNRGGSPATGVSVDLYWTTPAKRVKPNSWTKIGTAALPSVPAGNVLTVSGGVEWRDPPGPGDYCLIAVAGNTEDPMPNISPTTPTQFFKTVGKYTTFIKNNNNVASRNFDVVGI